MSNEKPKIRDIVKEIENEHMHCNCDLDNWQPKRDTGHSWVCRIDKEARRRYRSMIEEKKIER